MSAFLSIDDVKRLTGFERPSSQIAWCRKNGVQAWLSGSGQVVIPVCAIEGKKAANTESWNPDFTPIRKQA